MQVLRGFHCTRIELEGHSRRLQRDTSLGTSVLGRCDPSTPTNVGSQGRTKGRKVESQKAVLRPDGICQAALELIRKVPKVAHAATIEPRA